MMDVTAIQIGAAVGLPASEVRRDIDKSFSVGRRIKNRRAGIVKRFLRRARAWFRPRIETLGSLIRKARKERSAPVSGLYVLQLDAMIPGPMAEQLLATLDPIRDKYGIDFIVLEPGMSIRRFDEF